MGTVAEVTSDEKGLNWPAEIAPYTVHLVSLAREDADIAKVEETYATLQRAGVEVLYDDRQGVQAGEKMADADLIGIPHRIVISPKTLAQNSVEWKQRSSTEAHLLSLEAFINQLHG
jgi:prolyl-tRNA synthetase